MCFVRDEYVEFPAMCSAPVLSQYIRTKSNILKLSSIMKLEMYTASFARELIAISSASIVY